MSFEPPTHLANRRYTVGERLGRGSVAVVHAVRDQSLGTERAAKLLTPALSSFLVHFERFQREASSMAALHHPHVVQVVDIGVESGWTYIITELMHGGPLDTWVLDNGPAEPALAMRWIDEALRALQAAHEQGVVHRDFRPNNLLLDKHGHAKLGDFGLARLLHRFAPGADTITVGGSPMGRPPYAAPEALLDGRSADERADVYGAGMTLLFLLTGAPPDDLSAALDAVEPRIAAVVQRATRPQPEDRWPSAEALRQALLQ